MSYYGTLGIKNTATPEEITQAYGARIRELQPDKKFSGNEKFIITAQVVHEIQADPTRQKKLIEIEKAYEVLSDPVRRQAYDEYLVTSFLDCIERFPIRRGNLPSCRVYLHNKDAIKEWKNNLTAFFSDSLQLRIECLNLLRGFQDCQCDLTQKIDEFENIFINIALFSVWIAMHDHSAMLSDENFIYIINKKHPFNKSHNGDSPIAVATAFHSKKFILRGFELGLFKLSDVQEALSVAVTLHDEEMMNYIAQMAEQFNLNISSLNDASNYNKDYDPLWRSIQNGFSRGTRFLLERNINLDSYIESNCKEETYLHLAIRYNNDIEVIRLLMAKTKNVFQRNVLGETPFDLAKQNGNANIISLFNDQSGHANSETSSRPSSQSQSDAASYSALIAMMSRAFRGSILDDSSAERTKKPDPFETIQKTIHNLFNPECKLYNSFIGISISMPRGISVTKLDEFAVSLKGVGIAVEIQPESIHVTAELKIKNESLESFGAKLANLPSQQSAPRSS